MELCCCVTDSSSSSGDGIDECLNLPVSLPSDHSGVTRNWVQADDNVVSVASLRLDGPIYTSPGRLELSIPVLLLGGLV